MAIRLWKRKAKTKEERAYKTEVKLESGVFDRESLLSLDTLIKRRVINTLDYCVSTGKEADVYRGTSPRGFVAVKIFRKFTSDFNKFQQYLDEEMKLKASKHKDIKDLWAAKEFGNLAKLAELGIAPRPLHRIRNINVMEFLGEEGVPYPLLKDCRSMLGQKDYEQVIEMIFQMHENDLVHADLSEFNMIYTGERIFVIDLAQGVSASHPSAKEFLRRDLDNVNRFFAVLGADTREPEKLISELEKKAEERTRT